MGARFYIHVGDTTTSAGKVLTGRNDSLFLGHESSFEDDQVFCPACNSVGVIRCVGTRISAIGPHGKEEALSGDLCICRCSPPPRLVASQSSYWTEGDEVSPGEERTGAAGELLYGVAPSHVADPSDQRFLVCDEATGEPLAGRLYRLSYPGGVLHGRTDTEGYTERVTGVDAASVQIDVFAEKA